MIPGFIEFLDSKYSPYKSDSYLTSGLGPTNDICPNKTFIILGNSSREVFLKKLPMFVILSSFSILIGSSGLNDG